jgi:hypothetical protein
VRKIAVVIDYQDTCLLFNRFDDLRGKKFTSTVLFIIFLKLRPAPLRPGAALAC